MARQLKCVGDELGLNHSGRSAEAGFADIVGSRADLPPGLPVATGHGLICGACSVANFAATSTASSNRRALALAVFNKLTNPTWTPLTNAQARALLVAIFQDDAP